MNISEFLVQKIKLGLNDIGENYIVSNNPDFNHRKEIEQAIKENDGYCCCAINKTPDTKCMCKEFTEQREPGFCHCGRYYKTLQCKTVCLCGSTKFKDTFYEVAKELTLKGYIVLMPHVFLH